MKEVEITSKVVRRDGQGVTSGGRTGGGAAAPGGYVRTETLEDELKKYVSIEKDEAVKGLKEFEKGVTIGGLKLARTANGVLTLDANLVVTGGVTMYGLGGVPTGSVFDALPIDGKTLIRDASGVLMVNPEYTTGDGEGIAELTKEMVVEALGFDPVAKEYVDGRIEALVGGAPAAYDTLKEIADVLAGNVDSIGDLMTAIATKADKATTLAGYGITDAYTAAKVDELLGKYVTTGTAQTVTGAKDFTGGLAVNGAAIGYDKVTKCWTLSGNLAVTGGVTMYGGSGAASGLMDGLVTDGVNLRVVDGVLTFVGKTGGGTADSVAWENVTGRPLTLASPYALTIRDSGGAAKVTYDGSSAQGLTLTKAMVGLDKVENTEYLAKSAYTAADVLAKLKTVDGSGSGLDADTLDGNDSTAFVKVTGGYKIYTSDVRPYEYLWLCRVYNRTGYGTGYVKLRIRFRYNSCELWVKVLNDEYVYGIGNTYFDIWKDAQGGRNIDAWYKPTYVSEGVNYVDIYVKCGAWNSGTWDVVDIGGSGTMVVEDKTSYLDSLPSGVTGVNYSYYARATAATKLETPRKLWGQSFDGTGDVNGDMRIDGNLAVTGGVTMYGDIIIDKNNRKWRVGTGAGNGTTSLNFFDETGSTVRMWLDISGNLTVTEKLFTGTGGFYTAKGEEGIYVEQKSVNWHNSKNDWTKKLLAFTSAGYVGVGNVVPSAQLHVAGDTRIEGNLVVTGGVTMYGGSGAASGLMDGLVTDGVNLRVVDGVLTFVGKTGGGTADSVAWENVTGRPLTLASPYALTIRDSGGAAKVTYDGSSAQGLTLTKAMVGLDKVENTALSAWTGSGKVTTVGTITSGTWQGGKIGNGYLANSAVTISGKSVSLGGSLSQADLRGALGLGSNAYTSTEYLAKSAYTAADVLAKLKTVDGSGSGLEADCIGQYICDVGTKTLIRGIRSDNTQKRTITDDGFSLIYTHGSVSGEIATVNSNVASADKLSYQEVYRSGSSDSSKWKRVASVVVKEQYTSACFVGMFSSPQLLGNDRAATFTVRAYIHQQSAMGNTPYYRVFCDNSNGYYSVVGILNYSASESRINIYVRSGLTYMSLRALTIASMDGFLVADDPYLSELPSGTQITPSRENVCLAATKLETPRKLWGQSFDGTGDVAGDMRIDGNLAVTGGVTMYGDIIIDKNNRKWCVGTGAGNGTTSLNFFDETGSTVRMWLDISGNLTVTEKLFTGTGGFYTAKGEEGIYVEQKSVNWHNSKNDWTKKLLAFTSAGYVGVGNVVPSAQLHVAGDTRIEGNLVVTDVVTMYGDIIIDKNNRKWRVGTGAGNGTTSLNFFDETGSAVRMWLDISGNLTVTEKLFTGTGGFYTAKGEEGIYVEQKSVNWHNSKNDWTKKLLAFTSAGYVGVGNVVPSAQLHVAGDTRIEGNLVVTGGVTMYSDIRKKTKLGDVELTLREVAEAPLIAHYYKSDEGRTKHVGSVAQYWAGLNDWFCKADGEGYLTMEVQNAALASAISVARELVRHETDTDRRIRTLAERVRELKEEIITIKKEKGE